MHSNHNTYYLTNKNYVLFVKVTNLHIYEEDECKYKCDFTYNNYDYNEFLNTRANLDFFYAFQNKRICLLCAENAPEHCHRRLLAEKIARTYDNVTIVHL